jgi:hypothetical protein
VCIMYSVFRWHTYISDVHWLLEKIIILPLKYGWTLTWEYAEPEEYSKPIDGDD